MRILIASKHTHNSRLSIGGVQTWNKTIGDKLIEFGHEVDYWCPEFGLYSKNYDAGIFANLNYTKKMIKFCKNYISISHGIIPDEDKGQYFTSEGGRDYWKRPGEIIRQPIDLNFWKPENNTEEYLTRFSYRNGLEFLPDIAKECRLKFIHVKNQTPIEVRSILRRSKFVIATGRAAIEAMACGCKVIIADDREYQGPLLDFDTFGSMTNNYSGRNGVIANKNNINNAIRDTICYDFDYLNHVKKYHNSNDIAKRILCLLC